MLEGDVELKVTSSYNILKLVRDIVRTYLDVEKVTQLNKVQLLSVVDELTTNVVEHGYCGEKTENNFIHVSLKKDSEKIYIMVEDYGCGFKGEGHSKAEGGMGLHIVRSIVDDFKIIKKTSGTKIEVCKKNEKEEMVEC